MSAGAGTIQGTQTGTSWAGAKIAAILLAVVIALTMFAMTRGSGVTGTKPASATFQESDQLSGGRHTPTTTANDAPAWKPVKVGSFVCNQCR